MQKKNLKVRSLLSDKGGSKIGRYQELVIGRTGLVHLVMYELIILLCSDLPGALGLFLRSKLYPLILGRVGKNVVFGKGIVFRHPHKILIGDNVVVDDHCLLDAKGVSNKGIVIENDVFIGRNTILSCKDGDIYLDSGVNIGFNCEIFSATSVTVGKNTMIAAYCYLVGGGNYDVGQSEVPFGEQDGMNSRGGIRLGESVWLGAGVKVLDGVVLGDNAVAGAGAVVNKSIPAQSIAVGVPAKIVRSREVAVRETVLS